MQINFTDKTLSALKAENKRIEYRDKKLPGFGVRITPDNKKTFFVTCRVNGKQRRV